MIFSEILEDQNQFPISNDCIGFDSLFIIDEQTKRHDTKDDTFVRKVWETQNINIGTRHFPKYVNIGTSCTQ
jgi:hypothetical protein